MARLFLRPPSCRNGRMRESLALGRSAGFQTGLTCARVAACPPNHPPALSRFGNRRSAGNASLCLAPYRHLDARRQQLGVPPSLGGEGRESRSSLSAFQRDGLEDDAAGREFGTGIVKNSGGILSPALVPGRRGGSDQRVKSEGRSPNRARTSGFGTRPSFGLRPSGFGTRASDFKATLAERRLGNRCSARTRECAPPEFIVYLGLESPGPTC